MARMGLYPALIMVVFGAVVPFFIFKLGRLIGLAPLLALAFLIGLGYGAVKAEYPWEGNGIVGDAFFVAASSVAIVAYAALSYAAASFVSKAASSLRGE